MTDYKKHDYPTEQLKIFFNSHLHIQADSHILYSDGSKTEDGVGYTVVGQRVTTSRRVQHEASISAAELCALYNGIRHCQGVAQSSITLITNSRSSIQALNKYNSSNHLVQKIQCTLRGNDVADIDTRRIITDEDVDPIDVPRSDIKCRIKKVLSSMWNHQWRRMACNKLREVSDSSFSFPNATCSNRGWERTLNVLCRSLSTDSRLPHGRTPSPIL